MAAGEGVLPAINSLLLDNPVEFPLGDYTTVVPSDTCQAFSYAGAKSVLSKVNKKVYQLSDMDIGYFAGDYVASGDFTLGLDGKTLTLQGADASTYGIAWRGTGTSYPGGGINNKGRLEFLCYYDATYAGPHFTESIWFDKD